MAVVGRHIMILGGTSPAGLACAQVFVRQGAHVSLVGSSENSILFQEEEIHYYQHNLEEFPAIPAFFEQVVSERGEVSSLVFLQRYRADGDAWDGEYAVSIRATQTFIDILGNQVIDMQDRSVVIITSPADMKVATEQPVSYHAAKAALAQMIRYYAVTLGPQGIRVNGVQPGILYKLRAKAFYEQNADLVHLYECITPLGRMGMPEDIADAVAFLCSPAASFITGQILAVDGGVSLHESVSLARLAGGLSEIPVTIEEYRSERNRQ